MSKENLYLLYNLNKIANKQGVTLKFTSYVTAWLSPLSDILKLGRSIWYPEVLNQFCTFLFFTLDLECFIVSAEAIVYWLYCAQWIDPYPPVFPSLWTELVSLRLEHFIITFSGPFYLIQWQFSMFAGSIFISIFSRTFIVVFSRSLFSIFLWNPMISKHSRLVYWLLAEQCRSKFVIFSHGAYS